MVRRSVFDLAVHDLSNYRHENPHRLFASAAQPLRFKELPYSFRLRRQDTANWIP